MKLLAQTNRHYLLISLSVMALSSVALFLGVRSLFEHNVDERLEQLETEIETFVKVHDTLPDFFQSSSARLVAQQSEVFRDRGFSDTLLFNEIEQEVEPYRRLRFGLQILGIPHQVDLLQSTVETEDIAEMVLLLNLALIIVMFLVMFWAQKRMSAQLWRPFNDTLERLRTFRLTQRGPLVLSRTDTDEFAELNTTLERLTEKTRQDYQSLKRFTENASHEIQTPLAVICAKLETLLQSEGLNDEQLNHLHSTQRAASRLSRLQQNLLFLVKIENEQFQAQEMVDFKTTVLNKIDQLEDFIAAKKVQVSTELLPVQKQLDPFLAETLVGNIVGNAVKHNLQTGGWIRILLNNQMLLLENSGTAPNGPPSELIERFRRSDQQTEGLGLGLAIAKEICDQYGWTLNIEFEQGSWVTVVRF